MTADDIRIASAWAYDRGYDHRGLVEAAHAVERGELVVPGEVSRERPWSDVVIGLYNVGVDIMGLSESRAA